MISASASMRAALLAYLCDGTSTNPGMSAGGVQHHATKLLAYKAMLAYLCAGTSTATISLRHSSRSVVHHATQQLT
jgi:hypothetical protein